MTMVNRYYVVGSDAELRGEGCPDNPDTGETFTSVVLARDYDSATARIRELESALQDLYSGTAEYVYLNHLGDPHNTTPMRNAAKVLGAPALEAYDRLARLTAETKDE
jgi:hypothetical protein